MRKPGLANFAASPVASTESTDATGGYFTDGTPPGTGPTEIGADFLNAVEVELIAAATRDGEVALDAPNGATFTKQIFAAMKGAYALASSTGTGALSTVTTAWRKIVMASSNSTVAGTDTAVIASNGCGVIGNRNAALAAKDCTLTGADGVAIGSADVTTASDALHSAALASKKIDIGAGSIRCGTLAAGTANTASDVLDGENAALIACADSTDAVPVENHGTRCAVVATDRANIAAGSEDSLILASQLGAFVAGGAKRSALLATDNCAVSLGAVKSAIVASNDCETVRSLSLVGGYSAGTLTPSGTNQNETWRLDSHFGDLHYLGTLNNDGADYAEMFPNAAQGVLPVGSLVARAGTAVKLAGAGDRILGVVSGGYGILGASGGTSWAGKWKRDEFGARVIELDAKGLHSPAVAEAFDPAKPYTPRAERPADWTAVGLLGQLRVRVDATVTPDCDVVAGANGIGEAGIGGRGAQVECMAIVSPFDAARGYGIALCMVR